MPKQSLAALALVTVANTSFAASLTVGEIFALFDGVMQGDFNASQGVEGRLYVSGDLTGQSASDPNFDDRLLISISTSS